MFKPIVITKEINGETYKAQFNGISAMLDGQVEINGNNKKMVEYLLENVLVEPKIKDMDEYFGTNVQLLNEVIEFASDVMTADQKYFPKADRGTAEEKSK